MTPLNELMGNNYPIYPIDKHALWTWLTGQHPDNLVGEPLNNTACPLYHYLSHDPNIQEVYFFSLKYAGEYRDLPEWVGVWVDLMAAHCENIGCNQITACMALHFLREL